jgi:hypothetical protein
MRLKLGMRVRMSAQGKSKWKHQVNNPHDDYGIINELFEDEEIYGEQAWEEGSESEDYFPYQVLWDNGNINSYRYGDLDPILPIPNKSLEDYL